jgi:hypothetical protein
MNSRAKVIVAGILAISAIYICGLMLLLVIIAGFLTQQSYPPGFSPAPSPTPTAQLAIPPTATPAPDWFTPSAATAVPEPETSSTNMPAELAADFSLLQSQVIALRGLPPDKPFEHSFIPRAELADFLANQIDIIYPLDQAGDDVNTLVLLGLVEPDYDLQGRYADLYLESIGAIYDLQYDRMIVVLDETSGELERLAYARAYDRALIRQSYSHLEDQDCPPYGPMIGYDHCAALEALAAGDQALLAEQWLRIYASPKDSQYSGGYAAFPESALSSSLPDFVSTNLPLFRQYARQFVRQLYLKHGWASIDQAQTNPPLSTKQILHPKTYPRKTPVHLNLPGDLMDTLGVGWREIERGVLGEWHTLLVLNSYLSEESSAEAAEGWAGDVFLTFYNDELEKGALILITQWDSIREAHTFSAALNDYGVARFGEPVSRSLSSGTLWDLDTIAVLAQYRGDQTIWILAPEIETVEALHQSLNFPLKSQPDES